MAPADLGLKYIIINRLSDSAQVDVIDVASTQVTGWGTNTLTIDPAVTLDPGTEYYITIDDFSIYDAIGDYAPGIGDNTTWNFTTAGG